MEYKELGNSNIKVSVIGIGTWQFGQTMSWGSADIKECQRIIDYAIDNGINLVDTAEVYGESEKILGKLLKGKRDKVFLCTKTMYPWDYKSIKKKIEKSLKKLQTDYIDLYQIHWPKIKHIRWSGGGDMKSEDYENIFYSMSKLKKEGLIRFAGVSNFRLKHLKEFYNEALDFIVSNQVPYSLLWRFYDLDGVSDFCLNKKISFLAYSPLAQGLLTGRFGKDGEKVRERIRKDNILFNEPLYRHTLKIVKTVKEIAKDINATPAQVSLRWAIKKRVVASCLVGLRKLKHLEDNIKFIEIELTDEQIARLDKESLEFCKYLPTELELWKNICRKEDIKKIRNMEIF